MQTLESEAQKMADYPPTLLRELSEVKKTPAEQIALLSPDRGMQF